MLSELVREINPRPLGLARALIGSAAVIRGLMALPVLLRLGDPSVVKLPYFDWTPEPNDLLSFAIVGLWTVAGLLFTLGWRVSISGSVLFASIAVTLAIDQQMYGNHLYLMAWLVLLLTVARAGSGLNISRRDERVVRWPVILLMLQVSIVYGFSALTKVNGDFMSGRVLGGTLGTGLLDFPEALRTPQLMSALAALAVATELFIAIFVWRPRFRSFAFLMGLGLHLSITLLMFGTDQLFVFSVEILGLYPLFLSSSRISVTWANECSRCEMWLARARKLDIMHLIEFNGPDQDVLEADYRSSIAVGSDTGTARDFAAVIRVLEHIMPTLWFAAILRIPGLRDLAARWFAKSQRLAS